VRSQVAVLFDYPSWWANRSFRFTEPFSHLALRQEFVQAFYRVGVPCDIIDIGQVDSYKLVVVPNMQIVAASDEQRLHAFVHEGGHLLMTFRSGLRDVFGQIVRTLLPGRLASLVGATVEESEPAGEDQPVRLKWSFCDQTCLGRVWTDALVLDGAEAWGRYEEGSLAGAICLSRHLLGEGIAYYLGTLPDVVGLSLILRRLCQAADIAPVAEVPENVIVGCRSGRTGRAVFLINYNDREVVCSRGGLPVRIPARDAVVLPETLDR
jgi:beta-galactosidase